jgi:hypothetical protein
MEVSMLATVEDRSKTFEPFSQQYFDWGKMKTEVYKDDEYDTSEDDEYDTFEYSPRYNPEQQLSLEDYRLVKEIVHQ